MGRSRKDPLSPGHRGNFYRPEGRGEKIVLLLLLLFILFENGSPFRLNCFSRGR
jgi:hypothetical protein